MYVDSYSHIYKVSDTHNTDLGQPHSQSQTIHTYEKSTGNDGKVVAIILKRKFDSQVDKIRTI